MCSVFLRRLVTLTWDISSPQWFPMSLGYTGIKGGGGEKLSFLFGGAGNRTLIVISCLESHFFFLCQEIEGPERCSLPALS